jgi:hypothetical protein
VRTIDGVASQESFDQRIPAIIRNDPTEAADMFLKSLL